MSKNLKSKSLDNNYSDFEIENGCHVVRFISFESVVQTVQEDLKKRGLVGDDVIGYRVTEQGVEIIYK